MGLDTSHDCWHGAYSAFSRWRDTLAEAAGYTFHLMNIYADSQITTPIVSLDWGNIEAMIGHDLMGEWPAMPVRPDGSEDPLIVLLAHSDCEGFIQVEFLEPLAARLEELLPSLEGKEGGGHIGSYVEKTQTFIDGLRRAHAAGERVEFW